MGQALFEEAMRRRRRRRLRLRLLTKGQEISEEKVVESKNEESLLRQIVHN